MEWYALLPWTTCLLTLVDVNAQPDDRIWWFLKKTRAGEGCHGPLRQFDEAIARYVNGNLNCWACTRHWMRATREANGYCASPLLEHSSELSKRKIPARFYRLFDRVGANVPNYRPGTRWCNKCAMVSDNVFSNEPDYISPAKVRVIFFLCLHFISIDRIYVQIFERAPRKNEIMIEIGNWCTVNTQLSNHYHWHLWFQHYKALQNKNKADKPNHYFQN